MSTHTTLMSPRQRPTLSSLPQEIIDPIASHLTPEELAACRCVCKDWRDTLTPHLWRVVRVVNETMYDRFRTEESRDALARNNHHIRVVETTDPAFVYFLATQCKKHTSNIQSLTLRLRKENEVQAPTTPPPRSDFFMTSPSLSSLRKDDHPSVIAPTVSGTEPPDRSAFATIVTQLLLFMNRNLRTLSLDEGCFRIKDGPDEFVKVLSSVPTACLQRLEISFLGARQRDDFVRGTTYDHDRQVAKYREAMQAHQDLGPFLALTELDFTGAEDAIITEDRLAFLIRCVNLERIRLNLLDPLAGLAMPWFLEVACPNLTCLELNSAGNVQHELGIMTWLKASKLGWRELRLPSMSSFEKLEFEVLMEHVETLRVLRIEGARGLGAEAVLDLLCSARNLRRLEGAADGRREEYTSDLTIIAYDAFVEHVEGDRDRSWVLGPSVEYFQLRIDGVPRQDVWYSQNGQITMDQDGVPDATTSYQVQLWVYTQLGRMTGLKELVLGITGFSPAMLARHGLDSSTADSVALEQIMWGNQVNLFNYFSLSFSLKSGLELLGGLKELEVLDVRMTAHDIGVEELEWMHENWPRLREIRGLDSERGWAGDGVNGVEIKAAVDEWMDAHPRGIGSSIYSG